jgi:hypothetical protein
VNNGNSGCGSHGHVHNSGCGNYSTNVYVNNVGCGSHGHVHTSGCGNTWSNVSYGDFGYCSPSIYTGGFSCSTGAYFTTAPMCQSGGFYYAGDFSGSYYSFSYSSIHSACTLISIRPFGRTRTVVLDQYWEGFHWVVMEERVWNPGYYTYSYGCRNWNRGYYSWVVMDQQQVWHDDYCSVCSGGW